VLVIGEDPELAVALRDRLERAYVTVCEVRPAEAEAAVRGSRPWPWMVVGTGGTVPAAALKLLAGRPTLVIWQGGQPPGRPTNARVVERFSELVEVAAGAVRGTAGGMRLAPSGGVTMPDGRHVTSPALEALVAIHPFGLLGATRHFRGVAAALHSHHVPLRLAHAGRGAPHVLMEAG
jgi:hypothetical protein